MSTDRLPFDENFLKEKLKSDPTTWETRRQLAHGLFDKQEYEEAAEIVWATEQIPSTDTDLAFAIRILSKAQPRRAIRLLTAVLELNQGKAVQNMAMANALLHHGMVLQAARFYGAALEADPTLVNPDLEHFVKHAFFPLFSKRNSRLRYHAKMNMSKTKETATWQLDSAPDPTIVATIDYQSRSP